MADMWQMRIVEDQREVFAVQVCGPAELGRQKEGEKGPYSQGQEGGIARLIIAPLKEDVISRRHVLVEPTAAGRLRLTNLSKKLGLRLEDGGRLEPGCSCEIHLPASLTLGSRTVRIEPAEAEPLRVEALAEATVPPGKAPSMSSRLTLTPVPNVGMEAEALIRWIQAAMGVLQGAAGSLDFFPRAAQAIVDLAGLDSGRVLLLEGGQWKVRAAEAAPDATLAPDWQPSERVLRRLLQEKRTHWQVPGPTLPGGSLLGVRAVVAAPILDRDGEVIGALYGERRQQGTIYSSRPITRLEALLVELLAGGVAAGLARLKQEEAALRARVQMEQFFTPELARQLAERPELLQGRDTEVTVMVCDIRGFSRISEHLGPAGTVEWVGDVMSVLSECALAQGGVLVDYIGDEMMAMWGAPQEQPDHARRACQAALDILAQLPRLDERWRSIIQEPVQVGIGINTGMARVGNVGSKHKFKYGPLGDTVNLASRVQGATRYLRVNLLITQATQIQLDSTFAARRLGQVRVVNRARPATLYELVGQESAEWASLKQGYEEALDHFEKQVFHQAARTLGRLLPEYPQDGPCLVLMGRVAECLVEEPVDFSPVWELKGK